MKTQKSLKMLAYCLGVFSLCLVLSTNANATWYTVKILQVVPTEGGDVFTRYVKGTGDENGDFVAGVTAVAFIDGTASGANKIMATLLTAITLNAEVTLSLANTPSTTQQVIQGTGLVAP